MLKSFKIKIFLGITFLIFPFFASAVNLGEKASFFIDQNYDLYNRSQLTATFQKTTSKIYFYVDDNWWNSLTFNEQQEVNSALDKLGEEFAYKIYPALTSTFGSEPKPGIDKDEKITVLIHPMKKDAAGYFNSGNEYDKLQNPNSNEKEMVYLSSNFILSSLSKSFLAHEFMHLINFGQKTSKGIQEDTWLNEARAEAAITLLGYDSLYQGSNLERRVRQFLNFPSDSLVNWEGTTSDYGVLNLFTQYLIDRYGMKILIDSLQSEKKGIDSLNYALSAAGFKEDFSQIFTDWTIAVLVNDCNLGLKYCYLNPNLKNLRLTPSSNFLPLNSDSTLSVNYLTKSWAANWYKIFGGGGILTFEFQGVSNGNFKIPYLLCDFAGICSVNFLILDKNQEGKIEIKEFNTKYASLTIIPSVQKQGDISENLSYSWFVRVVIPSQSKPNENSSENPSTIDGIPSSFTFKKNLYVGISDSDVVYLKMILDKEVVHEKWSGNNYFGLKTFSAVKKFQEKYKNEISGFAGYQIKCTGFLGAGTRAKINQLLGS